MNPADSHSFITIVTQYLFIKIFVIFFGKIVLTLVQWENNDLINSQQNYPPPQKTHLWLKRSFRSWMGFRSQENLLRDILNANANTEYGLKRKFDEIKTIKQFQESVPLQNYEDYRKYIQRIKTTRTQNILTRDPVVFLAMTSGTTGEYKCIPVTTIMKFKDGFKAGPLMYYSQHRLEQ